MTWQYTTMICATCYELNEKLNKLGKKGWEAYGSTTKHHRDGTTIHIVFLKRPKS